VLTACVLLGLLLLTASIAPGVARAGARATSAENTAGAPGGATMASATQLENGISYRGTVTEPGQRIWYKLDAQDAERILLEVWGTTRSCPVRATVLDARGRTLGQLISTNSEILFFAVLVPVHPVSGVYYLRIDADPYTSCASAGYVFKIVEPGQPIKCPPGLTCTSPEGSVPALVFSACNGASKAVQRLSREVAGEAALVRRGRGSVSKLRRLESEERTARRKSHVNCTG